MDSSGHAKKDSRVVALVAVNVCLVVVAILVGFAIFGDTHHELTVEEVVASSAEGSGYERCSFSVRPEPIDINPGESYVLYTNYACPYCAAFYELAGGFPYTTRILLLDKDSDRFATQKTVSAFMLKLSRESATAYAEVERFLFENQDTWVSLDDAELLTLLSEKARVSWAMEDLQPEQRELEQAEREAPADLQFVPALYTDGKRFDGLMLGLVG